MEKLKRSAKWQAVLGLVLSIVLAAVVGLAFFLPKRGDSSVGAGAAEADGHKRMLELLAQIKEHSVNDDPLMGLNQLAAAKSFLAGLGDDAPIGDRINAHARVGDLQLMLGETEQAAKNLATAYDMLAGVRDRIAPGVEQRALLDVAVAHLRLGEVENCINCATCDSCILPIRDQGVHIHRNGSRQAVEYLGRLLELDPNDSTARWLLNIAHMTLGTYPDDVPAQFRIPAEKFQSDPGFPRFVNQAGTLGIANVSLSGGVIADDFNGDGWLDLVTSDWGAAGQLQFFRNTGKGKFVNETDEAGLTGFYGGLNLVQADYDNDGDLDVLVLRGAWRGEAGRHPNSLLKNDGQGHFRDVTFEAGLGDEHFPTQTAAWADFDNDGDLDLYVGNEGYPCQLFQNDGQGHFADVAARAGVTNDRFTKGVTWGDFDNDRYPDLYVSNYGKPVPWNGTTGGGNEGMFDSTQGTPNRLYRNNRDGTFSDVTDELNVSLPLLSFPTWFWDVNNDGSLDIYVGSYAGKTRDVAAEFFDQPHTAEGDRLYLGRSGGGFDEVAEPYGVTRVSSAMGANFGDLDNDGFDDMYIGTGAPEYEALVPNIMFHNQVGKGFRDVTTAGGFGHLQKGHAVAFADLDNDGDQDVYCVLGGAYPGDRFANALFSNPGFGNHWLKVGLRGGKSNRFGVGARIRVEIEEPQQSRTVFKWVNSGGSFGSNPLRKEIGLGAATRIALLEVYWPTSDRTQRFHDVPLDSVIEVDEDSDHIKIVQ